MEITSFGIGFLGLLLVAIIASGIVSTVVELFARGEGGKVTYTFSFIVALVLVFLAYHWDRIGVWTTPDIWIRKSAIGSTIVTALFVSAIGSSIGKSIGTKLTTPAWLKDDEEAAIRAISKEKNQGKLQLATTDARSYHVRSIAYDKLGHHHEARCEIALFDPDESACLAALDEVSWDGQSYLLANIAARSDKEAVALKALGKIDDDRSLSLAAARSKNEKITTEALGRIRDEALLVDTIAKMADTQTATKAVGRIRSEDALRRLTKERFVEQFVSYDIAASVRFEAGRRLEDLETCVRALTGILDTGAEATKAALDSIEDVRFKAEVIRQWLTSAKDATTIVEKLGGTALIEPPVSNDLEGYLCPTGCVHNYSSTSMRFDANSDDYYGIVWCESCGYRYEVDRSVYVSKKHLFGCKDKKVVHTANGYES